MRLFLWPLLAVAAAEFNSSLHVHSPIPVSAPLQHWRNVNLVRNVNLDKSYARETVNVIAENVDSTSHWDYYLRFEPGTLDRVGGFTAKDKKDTGRGTFFAEIWGSDYYKISLPDPVPPKGQVTLSISYYVLGALQPLPAQIDQSDKQYVVHKFSAYAPSTYTTAKQKTKLKLPTTDAPDVTTLKVGSEESPQKQGTAFTYGPFENVEAGKQHEVSVRYEFTKPLTYCTLLEREAEVSHWGGNMATEERFWLTNRAASLKNHFSRVSYQKSAFFNPAISALKEMHFVLAPGSSDAYFVDDIGNVSTSNFRADSRASTIDIRPRYPLFGAWKYSFRVGWNNELGKFLRHAGSGYVLKIPFFEGPRQAEGVAYEKIVTTVILPEGARNVEYETQVPTTNNRTGLYRTFLDTVGRTTVTVEAKNVVDEMEGELVVRYDYPLSGQLRKPLSIFATMIAIFSASYLISRLDVSIGSRQL
ncbi:Ribophorin I [Piedraia hortae CBS 480.64]|uniref:Dolichyl-diphosphooligosaccharide--protein glycosyltransferase subunit 1 n=1 Tax=Piedraia hortae CBS 480.64 TaxID=1314780 RepID=A0A6A7C633_9PEZI|nr:Ribophorin I [Piedraia hortae CBS 480.64]